MPDVLLVAYDYCTHYSFHYRNSECSSETRQQGEGAC